MAKRKIDANSGQPTQIARLRITITKTADGERQYVQIISGDQFTVNVVLIADEIEVKDAR